MQVIQCTVLCAMDRACICFMFLIRRLKHVKALTKNLQLWQNVLR